MANCTHIKLKTVDQRLTVVQQPVLASGDVNTVRVEYVLDSYWDGYTTTGVFYTHANPDDVYEPVLVADACTVPWEVLQSEGVLYIGLRGVDAEGRVKTAAAVRYRIEKGSPRGTGTTAEPTPDVYQQILIAGAAAATSSARDAAAAKASSADAAAASQAAVDASTEAVSVAQSVREDADNGVFRGFKGDTGRGYDGAKKLTLLAEGNFSTLTPAVVEVPNVFKCETVYIKCNTNDGGIYYGKWNGKFKDNNAGMHSIDDTGLVYLCSTDSTHIEQFDLFLCRGGCSIVERYEDLHQDMIINDLIDADENGSGYITIVATRSWDEGGDYDGHTYSVYIVEREASGDVVPDEQVQDAVRAYIKEHAAELIDEPVRDATNDYLAENGVKLPDEQVRAAVNGYLDENGVELPAVIDKDALDAALVEVLK